MDTQHPPLQTIQDIKRMMERSSRFISLSGWSGVAAGICALGGAYAAWTRLHGGEFYLSDIFVGDEATGYARGTSITLFRDLLWIAAITFVAAFISAFFFTWIRSRKNGTPLWDRTVQRLAWNTLLPLAIGAAFLFRSMQLYHFELIAPGCRIFY